MTATLDNPAARLVNVLEAVRGVQPNTPAYAGWMQVLGADSEMAFARRVADIFDQFNETKDLISGLPEDEDPTHLLALFPEVGAIFDSLFHVRSANMEHYQRRITDAMVYSMHTCARVLRRTGHREPTLTDGAITELMELVRQVVDEVSDSDLSQDLKLFVLQRLRDIEAALLGVKIAGVRGVEVALDTLLGGSLRKAATNEERTQAAGWFQSIWQKLQIVAQGAVSLTSATATVVEKYHAITGN